MYRCDDCKAIFEEPDFYLDDPSPCDISLGSGHYRYEVCPVCGSDYIEEFEEEDEDEFYI